MNVKPTTVFDSQSPEYRSNGLYLVEGIFYQSLYSYNTSRNLKNDITRNKRLGEEISTLGTTYIEITPDFGRFKGNKLIRCYRKSELESFMDEKIKSTY